MWATFFQNIAATKRQYLLYLTFYLGWGLVMNALGHWLELARFVYWWQVGTCYLLYLLPISLLVRRQSAFQQYLYGLLALAPLEIMGYALGTSYAYPNNIIDRILGERNFTLAMVVFFGASLPFGNKVVAAIERRLFGPVRPWV
jgi:hypothetical protein